MPSLLQQRGGAGERRAIFFLRRSGVQIIGSHITSRYGEIDILGQHKDGSLIVAEVKFRTEVSKWPIEETITEKKLEKMVMTFESWREKHPEFHQAHVRYAWILVTKHSIRQVDIS